MSTLSASSSQSCEWTKNRRKIPGTTAATTPAIIHRGGRLGAGAGAARGGAGRLTTVVIFRQTLPISRPRTTSPPWSLWQLAANAHLRRREMTVRTGPREQIRYRRRHDD